MIPSKAIKVYQSVGEPQGDYVTTVFTAHDAHSLKDRLFKKSNVRSVTFTNVKGKVLTRERNKEVVKL
mgnify:FL=1|tara:strand:- start:88 stop:291 length:204 start_codon:yes stop_codon:yes gene_type:complete